MAGWASSLAGWASGLARWPRGGNGQTNGWANDQKVSPFYSTWSPIGATALLPPENQEKVEQGKGSADHLVPLVLHCFIQNKSLVGPKWKKSCMILHSRVCWNSSLTASWRHLEGISWISWKSKTSSKYLKEVDDKLLQQTRSLLRQYFSPKMFFQENSWYSLQMP